MRIDDPASTAAKPQASPKPGPEEGQREHTGRGWHYSTHDLVRGTEVHEEPLDSLSDDLIDQLFRKP